MIPFPSSNDHTNRAAQKLRSWVPSALRAPEAGYMGRYVSGDRFCKSY